MKSSIPSVAVFTLVFGGACGDSDGKRPVSEPSDAGVPTGEQPADAGEAVDAGDPGDGGSGDASFTPPDVQIGEPIDVSDERQAGLVTKMCEYFRTCEVEPGEPVPTQAECEEYYADYFEPYGNTLSDECFDAFLDSYECYVSLECDADEDDGYDDPSSETCGRAEVNAICGDMLPRHEE